MRPVFAEHLPTMPVHVVLASSLLPQKSQHYSPVLPYDSY